MSKPSFTELSPNQIVRLKDGALYFGFGPTQLLQKIKSGEVPAPMFLSNTGRARGWTGAQIIEHQERRAAAKRNEAPRQGEAVKRCPRKRNAPAVTRVVRS